MAPRNTKAKADDLARGLKEAATTTKHKDIYYSTGCTGLDLVLGGKHGCMGFRGGVMVGIEATKGGGKSFLATETIASNFHAARRNGTEFAWEYIDKERRNRFDSEAMYGVKVADLANEPPETIEELDAHIGAWLKKADGPGIIVVDSLDAFSNAEVEDRAEKRIAAYESDKDLKDKGSYGMATQKFLSGEFFRTKMDDLARSGRTLITLHQMRANTEAGMFGKKEKHVGGYALDHWLDTMLSLKVVRKIVTGDKEKGTERHIGNVVMADTKFKSTSARPGRQFMYVLLFEYGIDNIGSNIDYLFDLRPWSGQNIGELSSAAKSIRLGGQEPTPANVKAWLGSDLLDEYQKHLKDSTGSKAFQPGEPLEQWLEGNYPEKHAEYMGAFNGKTYTREELILACEADSVMAKELEERVIAKWEAIESQAREVAIGGRKPKFA